MKQPENNAWEDAIAVYALSLAPGLGNTRIGRLMCAARQRQMPLLKLWEKHGAALIRESFGLGVPHLLDAGLLDQAKTIVDRARELGIVPLTLWDAAYPRAFRHYLEDGAPPLLFAQGDLALLGRHAAAVVGTRMPSEKGRKAARDAARVMTEQNILVVSGGASGVDFEAHDAAVIGDGHTIVILPLGIAAYTMPGRWRYARDDGRLLLISAWPPNAPWRTHAAVSRNALISAQAQLVCVIEPRLQGGSILTTRHAVRQKKVVCAYPASALPTELRVHARPLSRLGETLSEMAWTSPMDFPETRQDLLL